MAGSNRRLKLAAFVLPFLFLALAGLSRANELVVNTLSGEPAFPLCSLPDAIDAHNGIVNGCGPGSTDDTIFFAVTGTIAIDEPLVVMQGTLDIQGPLFGCTGGVLCGIRIDGEGTTQILITDPGTTVFLNSLTLLDGFVFSNTSGGGAIFANGSDLEIFDSLLVDNEAESSTGLNGGGAIYGNAGTMVIVNSTIADNVALNISTFFSLGGAIYNNNLTSLKITNATIVGNQAGLDGGIFGLVPTLKGTILADNPNSNCGAGSNDLGFNISDDGTCGFGGTSLNNSNPKLDPGGLLNNGGPTATIALLANSPAINRIPVAKCTDQETIPQPLGTDQRLFPRPDPGNLNTCDSGAYEFGAVPPIALSPKNERVQISRSGSSNSDQVNMSFTFQYNGDPDCDLGPGGDEDALNNGVGVALVQGTCAELPDSGLFLTLEPFAVHTVNHESYGTLFQKFGTETVSARMVALPVPTGVCGAWTLNLEVAGLNTGSIGLGGGNPFALLISDLDDAEGCFDINNAIVGNQIPVPTRAVRRGVRR